MIKVLGNAPSNPTITGTGTACPGILIEGDWAHSNAWSGCAGGWDCPSCEGEFATSALVVEADGMVTVAVSRK